MDDKWLAIMFLGFFGCMAALGVSESCNSLSEVPENCEVVCDPPK